MRRKTIINAIIAGGAAFLTNAAIAETATPAMLSNTCAGCHGTNGQSAGLAIPTIAGLGTEYAIQVMQGYRDGKIASTIMGRIAKGYTDEELQAIAEHYAKLPFVAQSQKIDDAKAKAGAKLHKKHCNMCHDDNGRSAETTGTVLAGQWLDYLHFTIADLHSGSRATEDKMMTKKLQAALKKDGDKAIAELAHFYASQK